MVKHLYDDLDHCLNLLYSYVYDKNDGDILHMKPILASDLKITTVKKYPEFNPEAILDAKVRFVRSHQQKYIFKRYSKKFITTLEVGPYQTSNPNLTDMKRPEIVDMAVGYLLSELVEPEGSKLTILPVMNFDVKFSDLKKLNPEIAKELKGVAADQTIYVKVKEHFFSQRTLNEYLAENKSLSDNFWKVLIFQVVFALAKISLRYPNFRHNQLDFDHIFLYLRKNDSQKVVYRLRNLEFEVPNLGFEVRLGGFEHSAIEGVINNRRGKMKENPFYDLHYFLHQIMFHYNGADKAPGALRNLFNQVVATQFQQGKDGFSGLDEASFEQRTGDIMTPLKVLTKNNFFAEFIRSNSMDSSIQIENKPRRISSVGSENSDIRYSLSSLSLSGNESLTVDSDNPHLGMAVMNLDEVDPKTQGRVVVRGSRRLNLADALGDTSDSYDTDLGPWKERNEFGLTTEYAGQLGGGNDDEDDSSTQDNGEVDDSEKQEGEPNTDESGETNNDDVTLEDVSPTPASEPVDPSLEEPSPVVATSPEATPSESGFSHGLPDQFSESPLSAQPDQASKQDLEAVTSFFNQMLANKVELGANDPKKLLQKQNSLKGEFENIELFGKLDRAPTEQQRQHILSEHYDDKLMDAAATVSVSSGGMYSSTSSHHSQRRPRQSGSRFKPRQNRYSSYELSPLGAPDMGQPMPTQGQAPLPQFQMSTPQNHNFLDQAQQQQILNQVPEGFSGALPDHLQDQLASSMTGNPMGQSGPSQGGLNMLGNLLEAQGPAQGAQIPQGAMMDQSLGSAVAGMGGQGGQFNSLGSAMAGAEGLQMPQGGMPGMMPQGGMPGMGQMPGMPGMGQMGELGTFDAQPQTLNGMAGMAANMAGAQGMMPGMMPGMPGMPGMMMGGGQNKPSSNTLKKNRTRQHRDSTKSDDFFFLRTN